MARQEMRAPHLDARLAAAAAYVRPGSAAADVGCDHGKLAAYLAASGRCPRVIASDVRAQPLARARALCAQLGVQALVDCRLGDGLSVLRPGEVQDIVIAGVSGVTAAQMLAGAPFAFEKGTRCIFVPPTKHGVLRAHLAQSGFALVDETPVLAAGRVYTVLCAEYTGEARQPGLYECAVGKAEKRTEAAAAYLARVAALTEKYARGAEDSETYLALARQVKEAAQRCL